jgi:hypothetical protein
VRLKGLRIKLSDEKESTPSFFSYKKASYFTGLFLSVVFLTTPLLFWSVKQSKMGIPDILKIVSFRGVIIRFLDNALNSFKHGYCK